MLKGNKGEWSEVYVLLRLLADGKIYATDSIGTVATMVMSVVGFMILIKISYPLDLRK